MGVFKAKLNKIIRPTPKQVFGIHDPKGLATLTQLRVGLSALNFHKFRHNFNDTLNPMCPINDGVEDTEHFLLHCHSYHLQRNSLLSHVQATLLSCGLSNLSNEDLVSIILYGDERLPLKSNKAIIKATLEFIESSKRFSWGVCFVRRALRVSSLGLPLLSPFSWPMRVATSGGQPGGGACGGCWMEQTL